MTNAKNLLRIVFFSLLFLVVVGYLLYYFFALSESDTDNRCVAVELIISNDEDEPFISQHDLDQMLIAADQYPKGRRVSEVDTKKIESVVGTNPFVREVSCYKTPTDKVIVNVTQRVPVIYVVPEGDMSYFLDDTATRIPNKRYVRNIIVASGDIDETYAKKELLRFAMFLQTDEFWDSQIEQVYVKRDRKNKRVVELVPRVGDQIIYLGAMEGFEDKLSRMRTFYDRAMGVVGWNKYDRINLEYDNQIICRKSKK